MKDVSFFQKIYLARDSVDFRKQAHGLALVTQHVLAASPLHEKVLFVFTNKRRTAVKMLYWDQTGYALWCKVLEKDRYRWPKSKSSDAKITVNVKELKWLLEGVDLGKIKMHERIVLS